MRSHSLLACVAIVFASSGCTHIALERRTIKQASTLTDLQHQQVLDNLAMFACNPDALAWHFKVTGGSVQVTDVATAELAAELPIPVIGETVTKLFPRLSGERGVVGQWNGVPAVESDELELLQLAYQKAIRPLDEDGAIRREIYEKICELAVGYNVLLADEHLKKLIDASWKEDETAEENEARRSKLNRDRETLYKDLKTEFDKFAALNRAPTAEDLAKLAQELLRFTDKRFTEGELRFQLEQFRQDKRIAIQNSRIGVEDQIVALTREICDLPFIPRYPATQRPEHNVHELDQVQAKIKTLFELADDTKYMTPWLFTGAKKDVPRCACFRGHYRGCGCDCYVWIMPEQRAMLRDFTLAVLTLAPPERAETPSFLPGGGITFSPTLSGGGR